MKIYTRAGDDGTTGLYFGGRVPKNSPRPIAYGDVDEAQAAIGVARASLGPDDARLDEILIGVQRDLWVLMAELATATENQDRLVDGTTRVTTAMVTRLEPLIDELTARFDPPTDFVVPGASTASALLDMARVVVRRAERTALDVDATGHVVPYLNRCSDLMWAAARSCEPSTTRVKDVASGDLGTAT